MSTRNKLKKKKPKTQFEKRTVHFPNRFCYYSPTGLPGFWVYQYLSLLGSALYIHQCTYMGCFASFIRGLSYFLCYSVTETFQHISKCDATLFLEVGWKGGREAPRGRRHMCTHSWVMLFYSRSQHGIVSILRVKKGNPIMSHSVDVLYIVFIFLYTFRLFLDFSATNSSARDILDTPLHLLLLLFLQSQFLGGFSCCCLFSASLLDYSLVGCRNFHLHQQCSP